jgi:hypothetical protein
MLKSPIISFVIFCSLLSLAFCQEKPDMIVVVSQFGATTPLNSNWDQSWGDIHELMTRGVEQEYSLGMALSRQYSELLNDINPKEIYIQSADDARAMMTTSATMFGLFHEKSHKHSMNATRQDFMIPFDDEELVNEVVDGFLSNSQALPNRMQFLLQRVSTSESEDLIGTSSANCEEIRKRQHAKFHDITNEEMFANFEHTVMKLQALGYNVQNMMDLRKLGEDLESRYLDKKAPLGGIPYYGSTYNDTVFAAKWWTTYNMVGSTLERSLKTFPLYTRLVEWFNAKASGENPLKVALLTGQEAFLSAFLSLHHITTPTCLYENYKAKTAHEPEPFPDCTFPEFGSQLIYEYYNNTGNPYIKMLYNGKAYKVCDASEGVECSLGEFTEKLPSITSDLTPAKFKNVCAPKKKHPVVVLNAEAKKTNLILPVLVALLGAIVGLILYLLLSKKMVLTPKFAESVKHAPLPITSPKAGEFQMAKTDFEHTTEHSDIVIESEHVEANKELIH